MLLFHFSTFLSAVWEQEIAGLRAGRRIAWRSESFNDAGSSSWCEAAWTMDGSDRVLLGAPQKRMLRDVNFYIVYKYI